MMTAIAYTLYYKKSTDSVYIPVPVGSATALPTYVGKGAFASGTTALTVLPPGSLQNQDLLLCLVESANEAITTPSGYTQVANSPQSTGTAATAGGVRLGVFYKFTNGTESNLTVADTGNHTTAIIVAFRGVDPTTPIHITAGRVDASATSALSWSAVTTTIDNCLIVNCVALDKDLADTDTLSSAANASLANVTERHDQTVASGVGGGLAVITGELATAGSSGTTTATGDTSTTHAYITIALAPAPVPVFISTSSNITAGGEATTAQLTPPSGKTTSDFTTGRMWDNENGTDTIDIATNGYTEIEWSLQAQSPATTSDVYQFRVYQGSSPLNTYTLTPQWTIGSGSVSDNADATAGSATGTGNAAGKSISSKPTNATATSAGNNATIRTGTTASATSDSATGTGNASLKSINSTSTSGTATATGNNATIRTGTVVSPTAGSATSAGQNTKSTVVINVGTTGSASGTGNNATVTTSSATSVTFDFTQADGPVSGFVASGGNLVPQVVGNRLQVTSSSVYEGNIVLTGVDVSGDFQFDLDCWAPTSIGAGSVGVTLINTGTGNGFEGLTANSTHIYGFVGGVRSSAYTNDPRSVNPIHVTFTHRASDGQTRMYLDGTLNSEWFITSPTSIGAGTVALDIYMEAQNYPSEVAWMDNLVISDTITGPPTFTAVNASSASATGTGNSSITTIKPVSTAGTSTGTSNNPSISTSKSATPSTATATGVGNNATVSVANFTNASAGTGTATGTGNNSTSRINSSAGFDASTSTGNNAGGKDNLSVTAGVATGVGNNATTAPSVPANATSGVATSTANNNKAIVNLTSTTGSSTGVGNNVSKVSGSVGSGTATGTGVGNTAGKTIVINGLTTTASGVGNNAAIATFIPVNVSSGTGTGSGNNTKTTIATAITIGTATGSANNPLVSTSGNTQIPAGSGTATSTGYNPGISAISNITPVGAASGVGQTASSKVSVSTGFDNASGTGFNAAVASNSAVPVSAGSATATAAGNNSGFSAAPVSTSGISTSIGNTAGSSAKSVSTSGSGTGVGLSAVATAASAINVSAQTANATGSGNNNTARVAGQNILGSADGISNNNSSAIKSSATTGSAIGAGNNATSSTASFTSVNAQSATASGTGNNTAGKATTTPESGVSSASGYTNTNKISPVVTLSNASVVTYNATIAINNSCNAQVANGFGSGKDIKGTNVSLGSDIAIATGYGNDCYTFVPPPIEITGNIIGTGTIMLVGAVPNGFTGPLVSRVIPGSTSGPYQAGKSHGHKIKGSGSFKRV